MALIEVLRGHLSAEAATTSVLSIAKQIGHSQPQVRAFLRGETEGSGPLLAALADHYGLQLLPGQPVPPGPSAGPMAADGGRLWAWRPVWIRHRAVRADGTYPVQAHFWTGSRKGQQLRLVRQGEPNRGCWRAADEVFTNRGVAESGKPITRRKRKGVS